jgi:hypothetical protein
MQNAYKFKNRVSDPDILLLPDTLLSPTKGGALSRAHGRPTIITHSTVMYSWNAVRVIVSR